jgi:hypothetical protein
VSPDPFHHDIETLWLNQPLENNAMTLEEIHTLAAKFEVKARRVLLIAAAGVAVGAVIYSRLWQMSDNTLSRMGVALGYVGLLLCGYLSYLVVFPKRDPAEPAGVYLRRRLQSMLRNSRGGWLLSLAVLLPGAAIQQMAALRTSDGPVWSLLVPPLLFIAVVTFIIFTARRGAGKLKRELDQLNMLLTN